MPPRRPAIPGARHPWVRTPIDAFVLRTLEARGLSPAPDADRRTLIRRLTFDLTGLPPTPAQVRRFLEDRSEDAYARLVDRLLASPHYGERWAQHWLDVVRFAESEGFEYDRHLPGLWRYRDYVVRALNEDRPYDRFVREQLAGDTLGPSDPELLAAAGFHRLGPVRRNAGNQEVASSRNEVLTERTDAIGFAFLGLTLGCARCHDHKFDPISQRDYYAAQAFVAATREHNVVLASAAEQAAWEKEDQRVTAAIEALEKRLAAADADTAPGLRRELAATEARRPAALATVCSVRDVPSERTPIHVLERGEWERKKEAVSMGYPRVLGGGEPVEAAAAEEVAPRLRLAHWITRAQNPLTARVLVNRLWQHHFGTGLVATADDFGRNGEPPSHPELLDHLACELVRAGWRLKPIQRAILLSSAYRQASARPDDAPALAIDAKNRLLWRFPRRRLSAEEIRDAMLAAAGTLERRLFGESIMVPVDPELVGRLYNPSQWQVTRRHADRFRRTIYLIAKRNLPLPFLQVFDAPVRQQSCARRAQSTHAPQALELLNGAFANDVARLLATRLEREHGGDTASLVERGFALVAGRAPAPAERALALRFLQAHPLEEFALALFNLNAFLYVE